MAVHALLLVAAVGLGRRPGQESRPAPSPTSSPTLVWLPTQALAAGGGEGGGSRTPAPVRRAAQPGRDAATVPVAPTIVATVDPEPADSTQQVALSAQPLAAGLVALVGAISADQPADGAQGPGDGPGADGRGGPGIGVGRGSGEGPGAGAEKGGEGPPGNGVSWPRLVHDVKPAYTGEAMRARISGSVGLSCVVDRDGSVRDCHLTRSLDARYGLDQEALRAVRLWRFEPARRQSEPVPVRVAIEMAFSVR